jgi:hypothetical protein
MEKVESGPAPSDQSSVAIGNVDPGDAVGGDSTSSADQNALRSLKSRLSTCANLYESPEPETKRRAVGSALVAVSDFLEAHGFPPASILPIMHPAAALAERENGTLDPLFCEKPSATRPRGGRPKSTMDDQMRTGILAAFANAWLEQTRTDSRPQRLKLAEAARKMRGGWFGEITRANLTTARDMVSQEAKNHPAVVVAKAFEGLFDEARTEFGAAGAFQAMIDYVNWAPAGRMMGFLKTPHVSPSADD